MLYSEVEAPDFLKFPERFLTKRRYKNPPITEALIDIRLAASASRTLESLSPIHEQITSNYPKRGGTSTFKIEARFREDQIPTQHQTQTGYRFDSTDGRYVLQTRIDGFTLSRLAPYEHWERLEHEARRLWGIYRNYAAPLHCIRAAVRYINRIDLPGTSSEMKEYFETYPEISGEMPQIMDGFAMQLLIPQGNGIILSLIQAAVPAPRPGVASVNLDLDLFKESQTDFEDDESIWKFVNSLRDIADLTFESCITDKARSMFGPVEM
jgi:uncharacterized protein (TIGR04255 family)